MVFIQTSQGIFSIASTFAGMIARIKTIDIPTIILKSPNIDNLAPCLSRAFGDRLNIPYRPQSHQCSHVILLIALASFEDYFLTLRYSVIIL